MKKILLSLFILFFSTASFAQKWQAYLDSGLIYIEKDYKKSLDFILLSKENLPSDSSGTVTYAKIVNKLGILSYYMRQYEKAESLFLEAKNIREKIQGKAHPDYIQSCVNLANIYMYMGQYEKAEAFYIEVKNINENVMGKEHINYAAALNDLASLYSKMGQYDKAEPLYLEAKNINEKVLGKEHPDYAGLLNDIANLYIGMGHFEKAEPLYLEALNINEKVLGKEHPDYAALLNNLASLYLAIGKYDKAEILSKETKNIREKVFGKEHPDYAQSCNNLGLLYYKMGLYDKAEPLYLEAKNIREKTVGKEHHDYGSSLEYLAALYSEMGLYEKAEPLYLEAKNIREKTLGKEHPRYASLLNNLANLYSDMGQYKKAEPLYLETKNITEKVLGKDHPEYAASLNALANLYANMGQYEKAEPLYIEAKNIKEKVLGKVHPDYAALLHNLAGFYFDIGQYEKAEFLYIESINIKEKALGKVHPDYAMSLNNLASLYMDIRQYEKAEPLYIEAKNIREKAFGKAHPHYAHSLNNLAVFYKVIGQFEKAEPFYIEAKNVQEKALGKAHPDYATSLYNLANLYKGMGRYEKVELLYIEAKNIRENVLGKAHPDYALSLYNLAIFYWVTNKPLKADSFYKEAFTNKYHQVQKALQFTGEKEKTAFIKNIIGNNDFYNSFYYQNYLHTSATEPYSISFLSRNLILSSSQELRKLINSSNDANAIADYEKWTSLKKQLASFYTKGKTGIYLKELEDSADVLEKSLARTSSGFAKQQKDKTWQDIQQNLKENEIAIEFVEFDYHTGKRWTDSTFYIALVLRKDKPVPILVPLFEKKQLDSILLQTGNKNTNDNVKELYASRGVEGDETVVLNKSLYNLVWKPIENELKGINTVYFGPSGLLHRIAFAALPVNDKEVLSDKYKLVELSTTANIIDQQPAYVSSSDKINLYGGIKYTVDTTALKNIAIAYHNKKPTTRSLPEDLTRGGSWNDLPGTKTETDGIISVAENKNNITALSGIQATEESIKALEGKNSPAVLHIATHGFFFPDPTRENKKDNLQTTENGNAFKQSDDPLFRSGLLFAGANNTWTGKAVNGIEDGILTSYEVSNMYLPNTKLVVLSACETGLGDIKGAEGVYGLQRAFKMAGAENLIMSLWKVPDAETAEFMQQLYKNLFAKQSIADAFYNAQTTLKNKYRSDPYKWAAWILVR